MFPNKPRPVPSPGALKVLYQLAYISSGTVMGVAALCAEERRRRIQFVQKIADNAKRLRQVTRHYQTATLAMEENDAFTRAGLDSMAQHEDEPQRRRKKRRKPDRSDDDWADDACGSRAPELPSVVEQGYAQTQENYESPSLVTFLESGMPNDWDQAQSQSVHSTLSVDSTLASAEVRDERVEGRAMPETAATTISSPHMRRVFGNKTVAATAVLAGPKVGLLERIYGRLRQNRTRVAAEQLERPVATESSAGCESGRLKASIPTDQGHSHNASESRADEQVDTSEQLVRIRWLLEMSEVHEAGQSLRYLRRLGRFHPEYDETSTVIGECFGAAYNEANIPLAVDILQQAYRLLRMEEYAQYCDKLLHLCDRYGAYDIVLKLFGPKREIRPRGALKLNQECLEIIAFACTKLRRPNWEIGRYFMGIARKLPPALHGRLKTSWCTLPLWAMWRSTRNLDDVEKELSWMRRTLSGDDKDESIRQLDITALDIYVSANAQYKAMLTVTRLQHAIPNDATAITVAALLFAKQGAWDSVREALDVARGFSTTDDSGSRRFVFNRNAVRRFNNIVKLFGKCHSATDTWDFVTAAVDDLGLIPNKATTLTVLQAFVHHGAMELIPRWLHYVRSLGLSFELTIDVALELLTRYSVTHRPAHSLIMWICHKLVRDAPTLAGMPYVSLVKEAVAYDKKDMVGKTRMDLGTVVQPEACAPDRLSELPALASRRFSSQNGDVDAVTADLNALRAARMSVQGRDAMPAQEEQASIDVGPITSSAFRSSSNDGRLKLSPHGCDDPYEALVSQEPEHHGDGLSEWTHLGVGLEFRDEADVTLHTDMHIALSHRQYDQVLKLYHRSLDAGGLPASIIALTMATKAALKLGGCDTSQAMSILQAASQAGMSTTCATGPLLVHEFQHTDSRTIRANAPALVRDVIAYYDADGGERWAPRPDVAVAAAHRLRHAGCPELAIRILDYVCKSGRTKPDPFNHVTMLVYFQSYWSLRSLAGLHWVFKMIREQNVRVTRRFMHNIRAALKVVMADPRMCKRRDRGPGAGARPYMQYWVQQCFAQRQQQKLDALRAGKRLMRILTNWANNTEEQAMSNVEMRELAGLPRDGEYRPGAYLSRPVDSPTDNEHDAMERHAGRQSPFWKRPGPGHVQTILARDMFINGKRASYRYLVQVRRARRRHRAAATRRDDG
jgi:hypothetical protein